MLKNFHYSDAEIKKIVKSMTILVDTREKKNGHIIRFFEKKKIPYEIRKLDYGDYSFALPADQSLGIVREYDFSNEIIVERKGNLEEISGNISTERDRLQKELALAPKNKLIMIEAADFEDLVEHKYETKFSEKAFMANLFTLWHRYSCPVIFMPNNEYSGLFIYQYFSYFLREFVK